ncbi:ferredoxin [Halocatena halophila]|uniref:ferredoxin n=1 Tax=Halocatena halophila TaxID=2814576 RepID=UPI002ED0291B
MTTEYCVRLDRTACEGVFACLVHDERFVEASDGLATIAGKTPSPTMTVECDDESITAAKRAAAACPFDAIDVSVSHDE